MINKTMDAVGRFAQPILSFMKGVRFYVEFNEYRQKDYRR